MSDKELRVGAKTFLDAYTPFDEAIPRPERLILQRIREARSGIARIPFIAHFFTAGPVTENGMQHRPERERRSHLSF